MMEMLAPDVTLWSDGGGKIRAALRPILGPDHVARWILGILTNRPIPAMSVQFVDVNGEPGLLVRSDGAPDSVFCLDLDETGITAVRVVRNPDKLRHIILSG
jgi:RNA polymerase sigma-70 factor (ECF subfamily)